MESSQLDRIEAKLDQLLAKPAPRSVSTPSASVGDIAAAPDSDLDGPHGDFVVKKDPPRYKGPSFAGKRLSQTSAEFCDAVMTFRLWQAGKDTAAGEAVKAGYSRRDAERALGWKLRFESGFKPSPIITDDDLAF
jgi:hypothetical protein